MEDVVVSDSLLLEQREYIRAEIRGGHAIGCSLYDARKNRLVASGLLRDVGENGLGVRLSHEVKELRPSREFLTEFRADCGCFRILGAVRHVGKQGEEYHVGLEFVPTEHENPALFDRLRRFVQSLLTPWTLRR